MLRDYNDGKHNNVGIFSGKEIEHTPAYGLQTLFLARNDLTLDQILALCEKVNAEAVYYGANRCFEANIPTQTHQMMKLLEDGYYVTVDYPYVKHAIVQKQLKGIYLQRSFLR